MITTVEEDILLLFRFCKVGMGDNCCGVTFTTSLEDSRLLGFIVADAEFGICCSPCSSALPSDSDIVGTKSESCKILGSRVQIPVFENPLTAFYMVAALP